MDKKKLRELIKKLVKEYTGTGASGGNAGDGNSITSPRPFADDVEELENYIHKSIYGGDGGHYKGEPVTPNYNRTKMTMFEKQVDEQLDPSVMQRFTDKKTQIQKDLANVDIDISKETMKAATKASLAQLNQTRETLTKAESDLATAVEEKNQIEDRTNEVNQELEALNKLEVGVEISSKEKSEKVKELQSIKTNIQNTIKSAEEKINKAKEAKQQVLTQRNQITKSLGQQKQQIQKQITQQKKAVNQIGKTKPGQGVQEQAYGSATLTTQGPPRTGAIAPTDEYPFSRRPKRTATGMMENEKLKEFKTPKSFDPDTIRLVREMLEVADIYHDELVDDADTDEISSFLDKRSGGTYIKFPHYNGPNYTGATFGKDVSDQIERSKAKAKAAALKTYTQFKTYIEDYEITDVSPAGVYGNIYLFLIFNPLAKDYTAPKGGTQSSQFEGVVSDNESPSLKAKIYAEDMMKHYRKMFRVVSGNFGSEAADEFKKILIAKFEEINEFDNEEQYQESALKKSKKEMTNIDEMNACSTCGKVGHSADHHKQDHEGKMAKSQLYKIHQYTERLLHMLPDNAQLPAWVQSKFTNAAHSIGAAFHYLDYETMSHQDNLMENVDSYKREVLLEGTMKKFFKMFDEEKSNEEVLRYYASRGVAIPEQFLSKARKQYEGLKKQKLEIEFSEQEAKDFKSSPVIEKSSEESKKLSSRLTKEKLDPVGQEDGDIDNDGDEDKTDQYLLKRRKAVSKAIKNKKNKK